MTHLTNRSNKNMNWIKENFGVSITLFLTLQLAMISGSYVLGKADREDMIENLKNTIKGYEKVKNLDLQETLKKIANVSEELNLNINDREKLLELQKDLDSCEKKYLQEKEENLKITTKLNDDIQNEKSKNSELQIKYKSLLLLVKKDLFFVKDKKHHTRSSFKLLKDTYYIGLNSLSPSRAYLSLNGETFRLELSETKYFQTANITCYLRLKNIEFSSDNATFDYGCRIKKLTRQSIQ